MAPEDLVRGGPRGLVLVAAVLAFPAFADTASYQAKHRPAAELAGLAGLSMRGVRPHLLADEKSNRVAVDGPAEAVRGALTLLGELDVVPRPCVVEVEVMEGKSVAWRAELRAFSGVTAKAKLARVDARVTATWVDGVHDVRAYADVTARSGARLTVRGQARVKDGERVEVARVEAGGVAHALVVRVRGIR